MRRLIVTMACVAMVSAACGSSGTGATSTTTPDTTTTSTSAATSTTAPTVTTSTPTSSTSTTVTAVATLPADAPETFVGVTTDYEAVEVDAATGTVLRTLAQLTDAAELGAAPAEEQAFYPLVIDAWKTRDGAWYIIGECCEPAAGILHWLHPGQELTLDNHVDMPYQHGWYAIPTFGSDIMVVGETGITIGPVDGDPWFSVDLGGEMSPDGWAAWDEAEGLVRFIATSYEGDTVQQLLVEANGDGILSRIPLDWVAETQYVTGLSQHHTGQLLAVRLDIDADGFFIPSSTTLVVLQPDGSIVAEYGFASGSLGTYDASGRYMIFVDDGGAVRWRGEGQTGSLAEGFIAASW